MGPSIPVWRRDELWKREIVELGSVEEILASGEIKLRAVAILKMELRNADLAAAIFSVKFLKF